MINQVVGGGDRESVVLALEIITFIYSVLFLIVIIFHGMVFVKKEQTHFIYIHNTPTLWKKVGRCMLSFCHCTEKSLLSRKSVSGMFYSP